MNDVQRVFDSGMNGHIAKPLNLEAFNVVAKEISMKKERKGNERTEKKIYTCLDNMYNVLPVFLGWQYCDKCGRNYEPKSESWFF